MKHKLITYEEAIKLKNIWQKERVTFVSLDPYQRTEACLKQWRDFFENKGLACNSGSMTGYKTSNVQIEDESKWFLAKIKYGI